jgi:hypothetical protein
MKTWLKAAEAEAVTFTAAEPRTLPTLAVTVVVPAATPDTTPLPFTDATPVLLELQLKAVWTMVPDASLAVAAS